MRGEVLRYDDISGVGLISGDDGVRYNLHRSAVQQLKPIRPKMRVDFVPVDGNATDVFLLDEDPPLISGAAAHIAMTPGMGYVLPSQPDDLSMWGYFKKCFAKSFDGEGRARRKEYWSFFFFEYLILILAFCLALLFAGARLYPLSTIVLVAAGLTLLVFIPANITVTIRRLHDLGFTGWLILIQLIPYLGGLLVFIWTLLPSQAGPNKHGVYPIPQGRY